MIQELQNAMLRIAMLRIFPLSHLAFAASSILLTLYQVNLYQVTFYRAVILWLKTSFDPSYDGFRGGGEKQRNFFYPVSFSR